MLAGRRQSSLDETSGRRRLRRQASETRAPPPILAWQESLSEQSLKQNQVEVVAKKIGQPKPVAPARPLRSPSLKNAENCLTLSRRQVAERLRVGWSKANAKEGQDKGRQNLNIFLNKSFEVRPASPKTPELGNSACRRSQSFFESRQDEEGSGSESTSDSDSSEEDEAGGEEIEESKGQPPPNPSRQTAATPPPPVPRMAFSSPSPGPPRSTQPSPRPPLSASARRAAFRAVGRQRPTTSSPEPPRARLMSAPPQARHPPPPADRPTSAPPRRPRRQTRPRRGVEGGEVVTMVSLVSPAESEDDEPPTLTVHCPPTPEVPPTPEPTDHVPPPPVLSLRRPAKAVTFKSCSVEGPEFRTSYPGRAATILQEELPANKPSPEPAKQKPPPPPQQQPRTVRTQRPRAQPSREARKLPPTKKPEPIQEEGSVEVVEQPAAVEEKEKGGEEEKRPEKEGPGAAGVAERDPDFRSAKERECWQLFKRMSSRGVSVSFETVLRGLLTPTEYRLRRSALLASC